MFFPGDQCNETVNYEEGDEYFTVNNHTLRHRFQHYRHSLFVKNVWVNIKCLKSLKGLEKIVH